MAKFWTEAENEILIEKYPDSLTSDLLALLPGRSISSITGHAAVLMISKSKLFYQKGMGGRICAANDIGFDTRFAANVAGWNKGMKQSDYMSAEGIERTKIGRFKKGRDPHNTVEIGTERISKDGYIEVKIQHLKKEGNNVNFEFKHRLIYTQKHGSIPEGMIVEFADGNKRNFEESNLVLRSRKDVLMSNTMCDQSIVKRFLGIKEPELVEMVIREMPDVIELKRSTIKLNQKINKKCKTE